LYFNFGDADVLRFGEPCAKDLGGLSYAKRAKIFWPLPCEIAVTAICFLHISILTGTGTSVPNYPG